MTQQEIVVLPPSATDVAELPLIDDPHVQYAFKQALTDEITQSLDADAEIVTRLTDAIAGAIEQLNAKVRRAQQEIIVLPPSTADVAALPLIADIQFLELFTSESLNRKFYGIVRPGIFRGFNHEIGDGLTLNIGDDSKQNTAFVERDGYTLTIQGQHPVTVTIPAGQKSAVVIEAFYQYGVKTKQVDANSDIDAASIKVVPSSAIEPHHVIVCEVTVPPEATQITEPMISLENRREGGIDMSSHIEHEDPHVQYAFRQALTDEIVRALDAESKIDTKFTNAIADAIEQLNAEVRRAKQEESRIDSKLDAEISRSTVKDNELTQKLNELMAIMATGKHDRGPWDASGGQFPPTPNNTVDHYRISASGTMKNSTQTIQANTGDNLYWELATKRWYLIDNTDQVTSVDGQKGAITLPKSSATNSTSETTIANVHGVKKAFDKGVEALERANDTYTKSDADNRFLGKTAKAADSAKIGGIEADYNVENKTGHTVIKPKGATYRTSNSNITGAFKVKLPQFKSSTMLGMHFRLFDYGTDESCELFIHGYSYTEGWYNCSAYMVGNNKELTVRFCMSGNESYLCIGNTNQAWSYGALTLISVTTSHQYSEAQKWNSGWSITLVTSIPSADIKQTITTGIPYTTRRKPTPSDIGALPASGKAVDSAKLNNKTNTTGATANTIAERDNNGDINVRLVRSNFANQNTISGALAFRINNGSDNYVRFCSDVNAIRNFISTYSKSDSDNKYFKADGHQATYPTNEVPWNSKSGVYQGQNSGDSSMVLHFKGTGSTPATQFRINYKNGGFWYKSARDSYGFEESWTKIYTDKTKPTASEIGALPASGKAADSEKLDGYDSTSFVRYGGGSYSQLLGKNGSTSDWLRTTSNGLLPDANGKGSLGTSSWKFSQIHGITIYENGTSLVDKYLGKTAKASSATTADKAGYAESYLKGNYVSGGKEKPNYFGGGKLKCQMINSADGGGIAGWTDAVWVSGYSGSDVKLSNVLLFSKGGSPRAGFRQQNYDSQTWGPLIEFYHTQKKPTPAEIGTYNRTEIDNLIRSITQRTDKLYESIKIWFTLGDENPEDFFGGKWELIDADATISFGDGSIQSGLPIGSNIKSVPLQAHSHDRGTMEITGELIGMSDQGHKNQMFGWASGAFHLTRTGTSQSLPGHYGHRAGGGKALFNASRSWEGHTSVEGEQDAKIDVRGAQVKINVWKRVA